MKMSELQIKKFAQDIVKRENLREPVITIKAGSQKGDGFLSDIYTVTIKSEEHRTLNLIFKCSIGEDEIIERYHLKEAFSNEHLFYTKVFPTIETLQKKNLASEKLSVPQYYGTYFEGNVCIIVLENMKMLGFELFDKKKLLDENHVKFVIQKYAKLHGTFFAFRELHKEHFEKDIANQLQNTWYSFSKDENFTKTLSAICKEVDNSIEENENILKQRFQKYRNSSTEIFRNICQYEGKHRTILHGDCWSNNFLFKYKNIGNSKDLEDICVLDWQLCNVGTPVYDLSYFLYSSCSKSLLDKLEALLVVYHETLSKTIHDLGCDPEQLYPFSQLKSDWKQYCSFGFLLGILLQRIKLINNEEIKDLHDVKDAATSGDKENLFLGAAFQKDAFLKRTRDLILHLDEIDAL